MRKFYISFSIQYDDVTTSFADMTVSCYSLDEEAIRKAKQTCKSEVEERMKPVKVIAVGILCIKEID